VASTTAQLRASAQSRLRWELLVGLVRKDLKIKYKDSTLGFAWSMLNPLVIMGVYYFVFVIALGSGITDFVVYLMSGLLAWNFFNGAVMTAVGSVSGNANLVKKVRFSLPVLPLSSVGFAFVHYVLQMTVFVVALLIAGYTKFLGPQLVLVLPAFAVLITFAIALSLLVSALNVRYRDVQHILEVAMLAWFWLTPIVYQAGQVARAVHHKSLLFRAFFLDPMATVVATFQRAIYANTGSATQIARGGAPLTRTMTLAAPGYLWYLEQCGLCLLISIALLLFGIRVFHRLQGDFAEEL